MKSLKDLLDNQNIKYSKKSFSSGYKNSKKKSDIFDFFELINNWIDVVGERLIKHTIPLKLTNKSLVVLTDHPVYSQQLSFMEMQLIKKIEAQFPNIQGEIKRIYFKADNNHFKKAIENKVKKEKVKVQAEKKWHPQSPEYKKAAREADELLKDIADKEIKESLKSLYLQLK